MIDADKKHEQPGGLPSVSVVIPTLNSERTLKDCLRSICAQDYPEELIEIIVSDGGSTDSTLQIIRLVGSGTGIRVKTVPNRLKTGEAGKAEGVKHADNGIIAFIDSDNILPDQGWMRRMTEPFSDPDIIAAEPIEYVCRADDGYITRYCAYIGMNDPFCLFLGNYDRRCAITGRWTEMPHSEEDKGGYLKIGLDARRFPTIGANGFLIRACALKRCGIGDYLFDIDVMYELLNAKAAGLKPVRFAKVKTGIVHVFSGDIKTFIRKQKRRVRDYRHYSRLGVRKYPWKTVNNLAVLRFALCCVTVLPLVAQGMRGYLEKPNSAWLFHPVACWLTLLVYGTGVISGFSSKGELKRDGWSQ